VRRQLLVVSTVHPSDDPRIRFKYIETLVHDFDIVYATSAPAPTDLSGVAWHEFSGKRVSRWFKALNLMARAECDVICFHDPELIPAAAVVAIGRRIPVVFDLHENLPAQIRTKPSLPAMVRGPLAFLARVSLRLAERFLTITLAEAGYGSLFRSSHPEFPNFPFAEHLPAPAEVRRHAVVYVGDVTIQRGALTLVDAAAAADVGPVVFVGRCDPTLRWELLERADRLGVQIEVKGWLPYAEAMTIAGSANVGVSPLHDTPNYRHSLPTKTLEYLAMGTPVIATDLPGTMEVIGGLPGVRLVRAGDADDLAEALGADNTVLAADAALGAAKIRRDHGWPDDAVRSLYASLGA